MSTTPPAALLLALLIGALPMAACTPPMASETDAKDIAQVDPEPASSTASSATPVESLPRLIVHKTPWCGCCELWAEQAERAGFAVEVRVNEDLDPLKRALGVPERMASCHTAEVDGYFVEGHVPFDDIHRLLRERPAARGIAVPGMPMGSPGMEGPERQSFSSHLVAADGSSREFAHHPGDEPRH